MNEIEVNSIMYPYDPNLLLYSDKPIHLQLSQELLDSYAKLFNPGDIVYDIGAYIGYVSVPFALLGGVVYAFEGSNRNYVRLKEFCKHLRQITPINVAVSNKNETVTDLLNDCTFLVGDIRTHAGKDQFLKCVILDDYIKENNLPYPDFIKVDIEGNETVALWGMEELINSKKCSWDIEMHHTMRGISKTSPGFLMPNEGGYDINNFLKLGYKIYDGNWNRVDDMYDVKKGGRYIVP